MSSKRRTELQEFVCNGDRIFTGLCTGVRKERMTIMNNSERIYVDFHVLQTVPPSCVNRDDTGSPKTAIYGGVTRARVSSQAWKRAMRLKFQDILSQEDVGPAHYFSSAPVKSISWQRLPPDRKRHPTKRNAKRL